LPSLVIYTTLATGGELQTSLQAAVGIEFLGKSSTLFDDIQDQDKPDGLVKALGAGVALNLALMLLQLGEEQVGRAFKAVLEPGNKHFTNLILPEQFLASVTFAARGQLLDLQDNCHSLQQRLENSAYYIQKCGLKTGSLIGSWLEVGALLGTIHKTGRHQKEISEIYRQVGFNLGIVLQLINDLKDFSIALSQPERSRDLSQRNLTLPFIQAYQTLKSRPDQMQMLYLWEEKSSLQTDTELLKLLAPTAILAFTQTIGLAARYLVESENYLRQLDPTLNKFEHRAMLGMFEQIFRKFRGSVGQVKSS
jgi:geranylgeranyl pyrophosphate synthase